MQLHEKIANWKNHPNSLGSEATAAVLIGELAVALGEEIPDDVRRMLKKLSLRGTMRDMASALRRNEESPQKGERHLDIPGYHDVVDTGAESAGISWGEAIAEITKYLDASIKRLG